VTFLSGLGLLLSRVVGVGAFGIVQLLPAWWLAGRIQPDRTHPFLRLLCATGVALVGYISFVNLVGRATGNSIVAVLIYLTLMAIASVVVWRRWPAELRFSPLISTWRSWAPPVLLGIVLGFPQWLVAVSTNFFDEAASSSIHLTAANQFAEGLFPPRHNAFPDLSIKYHYGFTILSGTVRWLTGLSANVSIDVASTCLWLFIFLFVYFWLRDLDFGELAATWGGFAVLLGGGLSWLYMPRIEAYSGVAKVPTTSELLHRYESAKGWIGNLVADGAVPSLHMRNSDGSLSNLPWDISAQFQQHAVALGIALTLVAFYLFVAWQRKKSFDPLLLCLNIATFGVLLLGHAVFGAVAGVTAGLYLLASWARKPTRLKFFNSLVLGLGIAVLSFLHGGLLARGAEYRAGSPMTLRKDFGYAAGGALDFIYWHIAAFGLLLLLAIATWCILLLRRDTQSSDRITLFSTLTLFAAISYFVPQLVFYSTETSGVEEFTEISKFFFTAHFALALLSVVAVEYVVRRTHWSLLIPGFAAMAITPLAFDYASSFKPNHEWVGFYSSPYYPHSIEQQMGDTLRKLKKSNHDVYFDASADERRHGYLSELLIFGGSVFTLTPSRYERTGIGYRISESVVAHRLVQNGRMARLLPGAAEDCACKWFYSRPLEDMAHAPIVVRSRFGKLVSQGYFQQQLASSTRVLYSIDKPTFNLDEGLDQYWHPEIVSQSKVAWNRDGNDLIFFDYVNKTVIAGNRTIELPAWLRGEVAQLSTAKFAGDAKADLLFARMEDTYFRLGKSINDLVERSNWGWTYLDSRTGVWQPEYDRGLWDWDIPFIADVDHRGFDSQVSYRPRTREWVVAPDRRPVGPTMDTTDLPFPLAGRFITGSDGDLGLWSLKTGMLKLQSINSGQSVNFKWGGQPGDILVNGDYDGDGYDEIAVWQRTNQTWYWRHVPDGPLSQARFGSSTGLPVPADYNHDGKLDLAYWEPRDQKIYVSYNQGRTVDLVVPVPPHSIPAFVNMY
jgi:FG-GAP-like repeat